MREFGIAEIYHGRSAGYYSGLLKGSRVAMGDDALCDDVARCELEDGEAGDTSSDEEKDGSHNTDDNSDDPGDDPPSDGPGGGGGGGEVADSPGPREGDAPGPGEGDSPEPRGGGDDSASAVVAGDAGEGGGGGGGTTLGIVSRKNPHGLLSDDRKLGVFSFTYKKTGNAYQALCPYHVKHFATEDQGATLCKKTMACGGESREDYDAVGRSGKQSAASKKQPAASGQQASKQVSQPSIQPASQPASQPAIQQQRTIGLACRGFDSGAIAARHSTGSVHISAGIPHWRSARRQSRLRPLCSRLRRRPVLWLRMTC